MSDKKKPRPSDKTMNFKPVEKPRLPITELAPRWLVCCCLVITFSLPNLVFSGRSWYDTLHLWKWAVTLIPIGILALVAGVRLIMHGAERLNFKLDSFGVGWLLILVYITIQPLLTELTSLSTFSKEWFYFAGLFAAYFLTYNLVRDRSLFRLLLWGANINAALNVVFAELLIRNLNEGWWFILDVPGHYIGNTAQQEMFGLWTAMAVLNALFLHLHYLSDNREFSRIKGAQVAFNILLLLVNSWGLWSSTTRGAILSLFVAFIVLLVSFVLMGLRRSIFHSLTIISLVCGLIVVVFVVNAQLGSNRGSFLVEKMKQMVTNPTSVGHRISIWNTSMYVFYESPLTGVGLGQFKWHFLDAQKDMYESRPELIDHPEYEWQFTYWAHSEYIQWLCETGIIGALLLGALAVWWLYSFIAALVARKNLPPEALWGCAMLFLLWFDAFFSRPFHRIENSVWMALAFALANRSLLENKLCGLQIRTPAFFKVFGGFCALICLYGFFFLGSGMYADKQLYNFVRYPGKVSVKLEQVERAERSLMYRDEAIGEKGRLYIQLGDMNQDIEQSRQGLEYLRLAYYRQPTAKKLFELLNLARQLGDQALYGELTGYLLPKMMQPESEPKR